ncbi:hypothetical protein MTO96_041985 [Rhipicephalus appendiculatus]
MQSKCLLTYGDRNVVVAFDEPWTGRDLIEHLKQLDMFSEVDVSTIGLTATALADAEDADTVAGHISSKTKEVSKARPDMAYIEDCMTRTLASRRAWVARDSPSVDDIMKKYPALSISSIVQLEFKLLTKISIMEKLEEFLGPASEKNNQGGKEEASHV